MESISPTQNKIINLDDLTYQYQMMIIHNHPSVRKYLVPSYPEETRAYFLMSEDGLVLLTVLDSKLKGVSFNEEEVLKSTKPWAQANHPGT